jgi:hypothetical protein
MLPSKINFEIDINNDELWGTIWEHTRKSFKMEKVGRDFAQIRTLFKDYTHVHNI